MRGLSKGEECTANNPVLQLFVRSGAFLVDPVSATFYIENVTYPDNSPSVVVALTPFDLDPTGEGGHRLGIGRFYIPTGTTASWSHGTHRAVCKYILEAGGQEYTQVVEFEILNAACAPVGQGYVGYVATRDLYRDGYAVSSVTQPWQLHPHIKRISMDLEFQLGRFFEPRFVQYKLDGSADYTLFLNEAIIAVEDVSYISRDSDGVESYTAYGHGAYRVTNRHLDGLYVPDDRHNPMILSTTDIVTGDILTGPGYTWPAGKQNLMVSGVFGFTDPDLGADGTLIGHTPYEFVQVIGTLVSRSIEDPALTSLATWQPGLVKSYKTGKQQIQFYGASGNVDYSEGITGDQLLDRLLQRFVAPSNLSYVNRSPAWEGV